MRILYLTHRLPYAANRGDRIRAHHVLRHLARRHSVDLLSLVHDAEEESHAGDLAGLADSIVVARVGRVRQLSRAAHALLTRGTLTHALLDASGFRRRVRDLVARRSPDAVVTLCSGMARFALEPPLDRLPFILDMVDVDSEKWAMLGETARGPRGWIYRREAGLLAQFEQAAASAANATLVVNEREQQSLAALGVTGGVHVVPNGVDLSSFRPATPPASDARVVFCGVMNYGPNEDAALWLARDVWPRVKRARPDARLTLVGASPTNRVVQLGKVDPSIEVTGSVPDVRPFLWNSAVSVAPLFVARGIQNKVLEAIAAGLPVVVSSAVFEGLPPEVASACAQAESPDEWASAITSLLARQPSERRATANRASLEPLAWPRRLEVLDSILHAAVSTRRIA